MPHVCRLVEEKNKKHRNLFLESKIVSKLNSRFLSCLLISEDNRACALYFKSEESIRKEKIRHLETGYTYIIHPLSKFQQWYEVFMITFYISAITLKNFDSGVRDIDIVCTDTKETEFQNADAIFIVYVVYSTFIDIFTWIDIIKSFFTGYIDYKTGLVELNPIAIARKYISGPFFILSIITSFPRFALYYFYDHPPMKILGVQVAISLLRNLRIITVMKLTNNILPIKSIMVLLCIRWLIIFIYVIQLCTILNLAVPRIVRFYFGLGKCKDILKSEHMLLIDAYTISMFKSSAYLLGIILPGFLISEITNSESYALVIITYVVGKVLVVATWVITISLMLTRNSLRIKFQDLMGQIDVYMIKKSLPISLRKRIVQYYYFKYHGKYFKEHFLNFLLSDPLKTEINLHICRLLIAKVTILSKLKTEQVSELVQYLIPEIYLPQDVIIQSGSVQDSLFFISTGTVAVYTHSGKEVCHLQDGSYFGEIDVVIRADQMCITTIVAVEICQIYRLKKVYFEKTLMLHKHVMIEMLNYAEEQFEYIRHAERMYKQTLFERTYRLSVENLG